MSEVAAVETRAEAEQGGKTANYWQTQLDLSDKDHEDFLKTGREVVERYKGEKSKALKKGRKRFNILFSNTETLKAATFARMAKPDVRRRFSDQDPVGRQVAEVIERGLIYCDDSYDAEKEFEAALEDYLLPGRGVVRLIYEAEMAGEGDKEVVADQVLKAKHWFWQDYRHEPARRWGDVTWEAFRHRMNRDALVKNFGEKGRRAPLNWSPDPDNNKIPDAFKRAEVWEIWDRERRQRVWVVKGFAEVLRKDDDPYGLESFFPNAEPLQAITTTSTFIPEPEFSVYRDQADGLDEIEDRIDRLTKAMKRRGVYDATFAELKRLGSASDNEFIPVKNYAELSTKGGLAAAYQTEDLSVLAKVLAELHTQRDLRVQTIYEVVGIADIMRGATDPRETLGAQKIKAQFGGNRLKKRQDKVQKWIRDTLRLKAEILAEHFQPAKLAEMTGLPVDPAKIQQPPMGSPPEAMQQAQQQMQQVQQVIQTLRSDKLRSYRIDVETDSTIFEDAEAEKQATVELITALVAFLEKALPAGQQLPELMPLLFEMLSLGLRSFKTGRSLEDVLEDTKDRIMQRMANPQQQTDPKVEAEKVKAEAAKQKAQIDSQVAQQKAQADAQKMQMEMQAAQAKHQMELEKMQAEMEMQRAELSMMQQKLGLEAEAMQIKASMDAQSMQMQAEQQERQHALGSEAMERKHEIGLETMEAKAKQAKQRPQARA